MSHHSSIDRNVVDAGALAVIREERSPAVSSVNIHAEIPATKSHTNCICKHFLREKEPDKIDPTVIDKILKERENQLRAEFDGQLEKEINSLKDKFDFILRNEQIRSSYMLREAHRERQEKIQALQTQLECKNLSGLMYVLTSERRKSKLEKSRITQEYTNYIRALQEILAEGQSLILRLSRGYKTAARVDHEWREKMKKVIKEFQSYVNHQFGGSPETNQYFFDLPKLLEIETPVEDDPTENPCDNEEEVEIEDQNEPTEESTWWERLQDENSPFVMFGDMSDFKPSQRREVLKVVKAKKTAPRKWKEYAFNNMFLKDECSNLDKIKDEYPHHVPISGKWECHGVQTQDNGSPESSRRFTLASIDMRGNMGSILKIMTTGGTHQPSGQTTLLAARDSMEIASSTKILRDKRKESYRNPETVVLDVKNRRASIFGEIDEEADEEEINKKSKSAEEIEDEDDQVRSIAHDSFQVIRRTPGPDATVNFEKTCPMEECQRMQMDSFIRSLPPYMKASPFMHFEQTYDNYEACSPEQLEILMKRIEAKKITEPMDRPNDADDPLAEWVVDGVGTQTSLDSIMSLPPCTCGVHNPTPADSVTHVYKVEDLLPAKQHLNMIARECLYDDNIEFNRFKIIGQESRERMKAEAHRDFQSVRLDEIKRILKHHPSLLDLFQANT